MLNSFDGHIFVDKHCWKCYASTFENIKDLKTFGGLCLTEAMFRICVGCDCMPLYEMNRCYQKIQI